MKRKGSAKHTSRFQSLYDHLEKSSRGPVADHFRNLRRSAIEKVKGMDFPTMKDEEWKYIDLSELQQVDFKPFQPGKKGYAGAERIKPHLLGGDEHYRLVFSDGVFRPDLSTPQHGNLLIAPLTDLTMDQLSGINTFIGNGEPADQNLFTTLNTALFQDGACIVIPPGKIIERPIEIISFSSAQENPYILSPRNVIVMGENSQAKIVENYCSEDNALYFNSSVTEINLHENTILEHSRIQNESLTAFHIGSTRIVLQKSSNYMSHAFAFGSILMRHTVRAVLAAEGAECSLNGLYVGGGKQQVDNHTLIDHARPHCNSHELYKGILDDKSHGIFNGKIFVRQAAQKTNAIQSNNCILLSDDATIDTKPQLEIFADDVKCTHGATVGQLDEEAYFYMRSRGIDQQKARMLLIHAFASEVIDRISDETLRERVTALFRGKLGRVKLE
jgi:Fe-S cluster assembly protein SufD